MTTTPTWSDPTASLHLTIDGHDSGLPLWVARNRKERNKGLLGTDDLLGALWITHCNWIHTFGMRYALDVVYLDKHGTVLHLTGMPPMRLGMPHLKARAVLELASGRVLELGLTRGQVLGEMSLP